MRVLDYLKNKYRGFIGVPYEHIELETLEDKNKVPKEATKTAYSRRFVSFEWVAQRVEFLNNK